MSAGNRERLRRLVEELGGARDLVADLPDQERAMVQAALAGDPVSLIAQHQRVAEAAVWRVLETTARLAAGEVTTAAVETGGLGSDTDPGVHGGYGDTAFGGVGNDPPPAPNEPHEA